MNLKNFTLKDGLKLGSLALLLATWWVDGKNSKIALTETVKEEVEKALTDKAKGS